MNHDEHLDSLLDEALSEYRDAEPLTGLEARVLRRLQTLAPARASQWVRWSIAGACAVVVALAVWIEMTRRTPQAVAPAVEVSAQPKVVTPNQPPAVAAKGPAIASGHRQVRSETSRLPALAGAALVPSKPATAEVFPVPVPLNDNERAFAAALNRHPEALRAAPAVDTVPVIAQIEIKPLSTTDETPGECQ